MKITENNIDDLKNLPDDLYELDCSNCGLTKLPKLKHLKNLEKLDCSNNELTNLPDLPNNLQELDCSHNKLITLPELPETLQELNCSNNKLTTLPTLPNTLEKLDCSNNQLTELPELPDTLIFINSDNNPLNNFKENLIKYSYALKKKSHSKWLYLCDFKNDLKYGKEHNIVQLKKLAFYYNIPNYRLMNKRELCFQLSKLHDDIVDNINNKCNETESIFSGDDLVDIPDEFFYAYKHNGITYCDDLRPLYDHFIKNEKVHYYTRIDMTKNPDDQKTLDDIKRKYLILKYTSLTLKDLYL
jgi:hypothetical protein